MEFNTAIEFISVRARAMKPVAIRGAMAAVRMPGSKLKARIESLGLTSDVCIAAFNTQSQHVISGTEAAVQRVIDNLSGSGVRCTRLNVNQGEVASYLRAGTVLSMT